jgi:phosphatidylglycerophosphate synthase
VTSVPPTFDAVILADSPHAAIKLLGLTLAERGRRVALKAGARRVYVIDSPGAAAGLALWDADRGDAALLVLRAGDQLVHRPLVEPLVAGTGDRRLAVGPEGYAGAIWAGRAHAPGVIAAICEAPTTADRELARQWSDAECIPHGDIARHPATTPAERAGAVRMLLRILVKQTEDSPVSKYIYRPLSQPLTRLLLHTPVTANQVSYVVALIGLLGCWFTAQPGQGALILGAALVFVSGVIDGCDGEISRLRLTSSPFGAWLDTIVDELTTTTYFVAIGYHTYLHNPEPWVASTVVIGALCLVTTIYAIYYFCIVVLKAGGSQYYVGTLELVHGDSGVALRAKPRAPSLAGPRLRKAGEILMYVVRRDFVNLAALALTLVNAYEVIYVGMLAGGVVTAVIVIPEHIRLRGQLREVARLGATPRLLSQ